MFLELLVLICENNEQQFGLFKVIIYSSPEGKSIEVAERICRIVE